MLRKKQNVWDGTDYNLDMFRVARDVGAEFIAPNSKCVVIYFRFCFNLLRVLITKIYHSEAPNAFYRHRVFKSLL
jgi:hypothetical protein